MQPSEFAKIGLVLFGATVLAKKRRKLAEFMHAVVPLICPAGGLLLLLVLMGHDLGTALVLLSILGGMLFAAGVPTRMFAIAGGAAVVLAGAMVLTSGNRMGRISTWLGRRLLRPQRHRLPDLPRPLRPGRRRLVGRRPRREPGEVVVAARGAQRLHLLDHR